MFSQNLVSGRDLFSSNPCRDFWDSQQFSQAASGSQSSQQSSVELFSQSKSSQSQQQRISTSCDWWSNTGNSQQINEDEPVKYYMKYLSKPPIFSDESKKDQEKSKSENLKKFIETQKTKTLELDQRY
ncbi:uncharacterized protein LOC116298346 [Actinia tenebrosa]|uniref:Uncharacterized protein LOC116298346 n=1 Tax=Actinia tenebrosa TaxID=6105 RepID=A0A6P8I260_ACTTE|nr:uncharacterized protein LOC116298346 [Actinia tenebrosa]